jgi:O-antigen/teichoic acid export membrane protein
MVLARLSQFLVAPLSDVEQLGLLVVAITIADVPFIFTGAVREVLFSAESAQGNPDRLAQVSRLTMLVSVLGSAVLAATLPLWIGPLFGRAFEAAIVPTWLTLLSQVISIPGVLAGVGLASSGRPGVRSAAQVIALFGNLVGLLALVPSLGALGAALAGIAGNVLATGFALVLVRRSLGMSVLDLVLPRGRDFAFLVGQVGGILRRAAYRRRS